MLCSYLCLRRKDNFKNILSLIYLCSRAIHIEVVDDLTTDAFINALWTFIAIRGNVGQLRCDQGTNFIGTRKEFREQTKGILQESVKVVVCEFLVNVPSSKPYGCHLGEANKNDEKWSYCCSRLVNIKAWLHLTNINNRRTSEWASWTFNAKSHSYNEVYNHSASRQDLYSRKKWRKVQYSANEFWTRIEKIISLEFTNMTKSDRRPEWTGRSTALFFYMITWHPITKGN